MSIICQFHTLESPLFEFEQTFQFLSQYQTLPFCFTSSQFSIIVLTGKACVLIWWVIIIMNILSYFWDQLLSFCPALFKNKLSDWTSVWSPCRNQSSEFVSFYLSSSEPAMACQLVRILTWFYRLEMYWLFFSPKNSRKWAGSLWKYLWSSLPDLLLGRA